MTPCERVAGCRRGRRADRAFLASDGRKYGDRCHLDGARGDANRPTGLDMPWCSRTRNGRWHYLVGDTPKLRHRSVDRVEVHGARNGRNCRTRVCIRRCDDSRTSPLIPERVPLGEMDLYDLNENRAARNLLMNTVGNTVSAIDPPARLRRRPEDCVSVLHPRSIRPARHPIGLRRDGGNSGSVPMTNGGPDVLRREVERTPSPIDRGEQHAAPLGRQAQTDMQLRSGLRRADRVCGTARVSRPSPSK